MPLSLGSFALPSLGWGGLGVRSLVCVLLVLCLSSVTALVSLAVCFLFPLLL